ncbi:MAG TPA: flavin reductase family protein [Alphaproteobacteria bacterium]|nr:flavin reductase family protein [Alphaproteobacteria bacterium]
MTGVAVATTRTDEEGLIGVTINSFTSVSLDPPMVLFCLERRARTLPAFQEAGFFAVNVLAADQQAHSVRFSRRADDWDGVGHSIWSTGAPIIDGCVAACDCTVDALYDGGDHVILIGRVQRIAAATEREPLVYHRGRYARVHERTF